MNETSKDELYKVLKLRLRPKLLLATNYEEAISYYSNYREYIFCLITDVKFNKGGIEDASAGIKLVEEIRETNKNIPVLIQSSDPNNANLAYKNEADFLDKNDQNLFNELKFKVSQQIGFGDFIFKNGNEEYVTQVSTIKEFEKVIQRIDSDSILFHATRDDFSKWLMARSEIQLAKVLVLKKASEFKNAEEIRNYLVSTIYKYRHEKSYGKVIDFDEDACRSSDNIVRLSSGALGGKGRGIAFLNSLQSYFSKGLAGKGLLIKLPKTAIIGTDEYRMFMEENHLRFDHYDPEDFDQIKIQFLASELSDELSNKLSILLDHYKKPLAVRSSGKLEDSLSQAFAGIFDTYIIGNNSADKSKRLRQLKDAIKLVYASVFSKKAIHYVSAVNYKAGDEEMAVVIQELVGSQHGQYYYPHLSGVAQSYNYYPFAHMKPEEGFAVVALGLGTYVVEGENAYRFSPCYPTTQLLSIKDQVKSSQVKFYALDLNQKSIDYSMGAMSGLAKLPISKAEEHDTLKHCTSVYDPMNGAIYPGLGRSGPRVLNFANILKNEYIPLAETIKKFLELIKEAFGSPVEIEFAVDLTKDENDNASLYILQVKPLIKSVNDFRFDTKKLNLREAIMYAEKGMGNGLIEDISDVIYIDNTLFDKSKTREMAEEIEALNAEMKSQNKKYILIGPGRWGTRDRWIGIPVNWSQISEAKVIVETSLEGFPLDASFGSHFFHNLTSMQIAYFSVSHDHKTSFINYDELEKQSLIKQTTHFRHIEFEKPLKIMMEGKKQVAVILKSNVGSNLDKS